MEITIQKHEYVLDWFEITDVVVDMDKFAFLEMQYNCGDWYLIHYKKYDYENHRYPYSHEVRLAYPKRALKALGEHVIQFSFVYKEQKEDFYRELINLVSE